MDMKIMNVVPIGLVVAVGVALGTMTGSALTSAKPCAPDANDEKLEKWTRHLAQTRAEFSNEINDLIGGGTCITPNRLIKLFNDINRLGP